MRCSPLMTVVGIALIQTACADTRTPTDARAPRDVASADRTVDGETGKVVSIFDACDPATFGQAGVSCTRPGGVTFEQFIALVTQNQKAGAWHFAPSELHVKVGETFIAFNRGGEEHTFTEVEHFGGGIIPGLNVLSGNPVEAEECKSPRLPPPRSRGRVRQRTPTRKAPSSISAASTRGCERS